MRYFGKKNKFIKSGDPFTIQSGRYRDVSVGSVYRSGWAEDVFISENQEKETLGKNFNPQKIYIIFIVIFIFISLLISKVAWLQIVKGGYYYEMAEGNRVRIKRIEAKRGVVYDRNMKPLVRNRANFMLYAIPADLPDEQDKEYSLDYIISEISAILKNKTKEELLSLFQSFKKGSLESYQPVFIEDNIPYEEAMKLYLKSSNWPGIFLSSQSKREYLNSYSKNDSENQVTFGISLSHILGYTGKINATELEKFGEEYLPIDYIGKMGIEYFWENELKGENGKKQIEMDALGKEKKNIGQFDPVDGNNLVLSLDLEMQLKLEEILSKNLETAKLSRASGVVLDPNNGEVLAMVSWPAYDNNLFAGGVSQEEYSFLINHPDKPLFNRAVSGEFPSGSTFKPIVAVAALEERVISENTTFLSVGGIRIGQWFFPDWRGGGHGSVNVYKAISDSVNTFFYYIGGGYDDFIGLGVDRIVEYSKLFGLGSQSGIDLAGEASGFVPTKEWKEETKNESWYIGDTYHFAIGQGDLLVTPLQVAVYTSVFANGGKLYRPHLVRNILDSHDSIQQIPQIEPVRKDFIDDYNMEVVRKAMRRTVTDGSGRRLSSLSQTSAGKTGTAQWSSKKDPHAWYIGFAPFEQPKIAFAFLIEEGKEGSVIAVSVARDFLEWYFSKNF